MRRVELRALEFTGRYYQVAGTVWVDADRVTRVVRPRPEGYDTPRLEVYLDTKEMVLVHDMAGVIDLLMPPREEPRP